MSILFAFLYRINVEERALVQALGERYRAYIKRTKRLISLRVLMTEPQTCGELEEQMFALRYACSYNSR